MRRSPDVPRVSGELLSPEREFIDLPDVFRSGRHCPTTVAYPSFGGERGGWSGRRVSGVTWELRRQVVNGRLLIRGRSGGSARPRLQWGAAIRACFCSGRCLRVRGPRLFLCWLSVWCCRGWRFLVGRS